MCTFDCKDCGVDTSDIEEYYMVKDAVWVQAFDGKLTVEDCPDDPRDTGLVLRTGDETLDECMLCIGCLEERIGRKLTTNDFSRAVCLNVLNEKDGSDRLKQRMGVKT